MQNRNGKLKILYIMKILFEKTDDTHYLSIKEIINELEKYDIKAERKSIYSDIELLQQFGIDIKCEKGRSNQYNVVSRDFEIPELKLLVDAVQSSKFITIKKSRELIKKLANLCSVYESKQLNRQVLVGDRVKTMNESIYLNVDKIHNAILDNKQIKFQYFEYTVDKEMKFRRDGDYYIASPYGLTWGDDNYYLIAFYERYNGISQFRVDRMLNIELLDEKRKGVENKNNFNIADYSKKLFNMFSGEEERVDILFDNSLVNVVIDRFGKDIIIRKVDENSFKISVNIVPETTFLSWVFMFGEKARIVYPESIIEKMKERLEIVRESYL